MGWATPNISQLAPAKLPISSHWETQKKRFFALAVTPPKFNSKSPWKMIVALLLQVSILSFLGSDLLLGANCFFFQAVIFHGNGTRPAGSRSLFDEA